MTSPGDQQSTADYNTLTDGCGFVSLDGWSVATLTGADRHKFLHNTCTNDITKLAAGQGCEAFCTDVKGKIVAHVFVLIGAEKTYLVTVPEQADKLIAHLDRYIIREDVQLADETNELGTFFLAGSDTTKLLEQVAPAATLTEPWQNKHVEVEGGEILLAGFPLPGRVALLALVPSSNTEQFSEQLRNAGATACGFTAWNTLRIESGLPLYDLDFGGENLPQEVARDIQAISFTKGCYLGQETVARLDALGHVNKQLVTVKFAGDAAPRPPVPITYQDKHVGDATSVTESPAIGGSIGIAMVPREANAVGSVLESPAGSAEVIATPVVGSV